MLPFLLETKAASHAAVFLRDESGIYFAISRRDLMPPFLYRAVRGGATGTVRAVPLFPEHI